MSNSVYNSQPAPIRNNPDLSNRVNCSSQKLKFVIGMILIIGGAILAGLLFSQIGTLSLACLGGVVIGGIIIWWGRSTTSMPIPTSSFSKKGKKQEKIETTANKHSDSIRASSEGKKKQAVSTSSFSKKGKKQEKIETTANEHSDSIHASSKSKKQQAFQIDIKSQKIDVDRLRKNHTLNPKLECSEGKEKDEEEFKQIPYLEIQDTFFDSHSKTKQSMPEGYLRCPLYLRYNQETHFLTPAYTVLQVGTGAHDYMLATRAIRKDSTVKKLNFTWVALGMPVSMPISLKKENLQTWFPDFKNLNAWWVGSLHRSFDSNFLLYEQGSFQDLLPDRSFFGCVRINVYIDRDSGNFYFNSVEKNKLYFICCKGFNLIKEYVTEHVKCDAGRNKNCNIYSAVNIQKAKNDATGQIIYVILKAPEVDPNFSISK